MEEYEGKSAVSTLSFLPPPHPISTLLLLSLDNKERVDRFAQNKRQQYGLFKRKNEGEHMRYRVFREQI